MASPKKVKSEVVNDVESMETKAPKKQVSNNTLNKDGLIKGSIVNQEDYWKIKNK